MTRKVTVLLIKIIISIALISFLFIKLGFNQIVLQFSKANIWWIILGITAFSLSNVLGSFQWYLLMKSKGIRLSFLQVLNYYYVGLFFNNFLIGYVGGDAVRIYDITKSSGDSSNAISTVFFDRFIGFFMLTSLALFASLIWHQIFHSRIILFVIISIFACWILTILFLFNKNFARKFSWLVKWIFPAKINSKIKEVYNSIHSFKKSRQTLISVTLISIVIQFLRIIVHFFGALSLGIHAHLKYFIIFIPVIALLASLPISIGGIGIRESSGIALFSQLPTLQPEMIVAMEFLAYLIGLFSTIPGGLIFIIRKEKVAI